MIAYPIGFEIAGDFGMFADPCTGSESASYPLPPPSACIGMIESCCRIKGVKLEIVAIGVCAKPQYTHYTYNSRSPFRLKDQIEKDNALQLHESVLLRPRFQILALALNTNSKPSPAKYQNVNCAHSFQNQFFRRLKRGQSYHPVSLGRKEFMATYLGKPITKINDCSFDVPTMVMSVFDDDKPGGCVDVVTARNVKIEAGVLRLTDQEVTLRDGILVFQDQKIQQKLDVEWSKLC